VDEKDDSDFVQAGALYRVMKEDECERLEKAIKALKVKK